jgi:hypothetical protein
MIFSSSKGADFLLQIIDFASGVPSDLRLTIELQLEYEDLIDAENDRF